MSTTLSRSFATHLAVAILSGVLVSLTQCSCEKTQEPVTVKHRDSVQAISQRPPLNIPLAKAKVVWHEPRIVHKRFVHGLRVADTSLMKQRDTSGNTLVHKDSGLVQRETLVERTTNVQSDTVEIIRPFTACLDTTLNCFGVHAEFDYPEMLWRNLTVSVCPDTMTAITTTQYTLPKQPWMQEAAPYAIGTVGVVAFVVGFFLGKN